MIDKENIKKMVDHVLHPNKKRFVDNNIMHPEREWLIGVLIGIIVCVSVVSWGLYTFNFYKNIEAKNHNDETEGIVYRESLVTKTMQDFKQREEVYDELLSKNISLQATSSQNNIIQSATSTDIVGEEILNDDVIEMEGQAESESVDVISLPSVSELEEGGVDVGDGVNSN